MQSPGQSSFFPSDNLSVHLFHQFNDRSLPPSYYSCLVKTSHPQAQASAPLMIGENPGETFELEEGMWHSVGQVHKLLVLQNAQKYTFA